MTTTFVGAQVFLPTEITETNVTFEDGAIVEIGGDVVDAKGLILAPALIDLDGDAFKIVNIVHPELPQKRWAKTATKQREALHDRVAMIKRLWVKGRAAYRSAPAL